MLTDGAAAPWRPALCSHWCVCRHPLGDERGREAAPGDGTRIDGDVSQGLDLLNTVLLVFTDVAAHSGTGASEEHSLHSADVPACVSGVPGVTGACWECVQCRIQ